MRLLLDTQSVIWMLEDPHRLSPVAQAAIDDADNQLFYSTMSVLEIAIKVSIGKLRAPERLFQRLTQFECVALQVTNEHAWRVSILPLIHRDPFDRAIIAQAMVEGLVLVTSDHILPRYGCALLKA